MAEEKQAAPAPVIKIISNYVKDLSFENIAVQNDYVIKQQPKFEMNLDINNRKLSDDTYEVTLNIKVKAVEGEQTVFILDLDHAGRFLLQNTTEENLVPFLYIECPRLLFPYTRRIVATTTLDGGLLPLNLDSIDFFALFQKSLEEARKKNSQKAE